MCARIYIYIYTVRVYYYIRALSGARAFPRLFFALRREKFIARKGKGGGGRLERLEIELVGDFYAGQRRVIDAWMCVREAAKVESFSVVMGRCESEFEGDRGEIDWAFFT